VRNESPNNDVDTNSNLFKKRQTKVKSTSFRFLNLPIGLGKFRRSFLIAAYFFFLFRCDPPIGTWTESKYLGCFFALRLHKHPKRLSVSFSILLARDVCIFACLSNSVRRMNPILKWHPRRKHCEIKLKTILCDLFWLSFLLFKQRWLDLREGNPVLRPRIVVDTQ